MQKQDKEIFKMRKLKSAKGLTSVGLGVAFVAAAAAGATSAADAQNLNVSEKAAETAKSTENALTNNSITIKTTELDNLESSVKKLKDSGFTVVVKDNPEPKVINSTEDLKAYKKEIESLNKDLLGKLQKGDKKETIQIVKTQAVASNITSGLTVVQSGKDASLEISNPDIAKKLQLANLSSDHIQSIQIEVVTGGKIDVKSIDSLKLQDFEYKQEGNTLKVTAKDSAINKVKGLNGGVEKIDKLPIKWVNDANKDTEVTFKITTKSGQSYSLKETVKAPKSEEKVAPAKPEVKKDIPPKSPEIATTTTKTSEQNKTTGDKQSTEQAKQTKNNLPKTENNNSPVAEKEQTQTKEKNTEKPKNEPVKENKNKSEDKKEDKPESVATIEVGGKFKLNNLAPVYVTAKDAINGVNAKLNYKAGEYTVYKKVDGAINITKTPGVPGGWISLNTDSATSVAKDSDKVGEKTQGNKFKLEKNVAIFLTAQDSIKNTNAKGFYKSGEYFVYKEVPGSINITKTPGVPGAWISTGEKVSGETKDEVPNGEGKGQISSGEKIGDNKYKLSSDVAIFITAQDSVKKQNSKGKFKAGDYFIFKETKDAINITKTPGVPGAWIAKVTEESKPSTQPEKPKEKQPIQENKTPSNEQKQDSKTPITDKVISENTNGAKFNKVTKAQQDAVNAPSEEVKKKAREANFSVEVVVKPLGVENEQQATENVKSIAKEQLAAIESAQKSKEKKANIKIVEYRSNGFKEEASKQSSKITKHLTQDGKLIYTSDGEQGPVNRVGYAFASTKKDEQGNTIHYYKEVDKNKVIPNTTLK